MMQRTIEVQHPGTHEPSDDQVKAALADVLKADGLKQPGSYEAQLVVNTSGGPSKVQVTFDEPAARAAGKPRKRAAAKAASSGEDATSEPAVVDATTPAVTSPVDNAANADGQ